MITRPPSLTSRGELMQRCHACNRQFGLVRHRWWGYQFCKKKCLNDFLVKRSQQIGHMTGGFEASSTAPVRSSLNGLWKAENA
jgi:hypothetical protein